MKAEILNKIKSVKLCLMAHPDNEVASEFEDRISDLVEIENDLQQEMHSKEEVLDILKTFLYDSQMGEDVEYVELWFEKFKNK